MDYKNNNQKNDVLKSLKELEVIFNNNIDCSVNPKLCNFSTLLSQTIHKTILFIENKNNTKNTNSNTKLNIQDRNINFEQLSKLNN